MKKQLISAIIIGIVAVTAAYAGPDENQRQLMQRVQEQKAKLKAVEAAKGAERQKLMDQHMKVTTEIMENMRAMKPTAGMTAKQQEEWISEHQKLMEQVMGQMMEEHHLLMMDKK